MGAPGSGTAAPDCGTVPESAENAGAPGASISHPPSQAPSHAPSRLPRHAKYVLHQTASDAPSRSRGMRFMDDPPRLWNLFLLHGPGRILAQTAVLADEGLLRLRVVAQLPVE